MENLNPYPYIIAAYGISCTAVVSYTIYTILQKVRLKRVLSVIDEESR